MQGDAPVIGAFVEMYCHNHGIVRAGEDCFKRGDDWDSRVDVCIIEEDGERVAELSGFIVGVELGDIRWWHWWRWWRLIHFSKTRWLAAVRAVNDKLGLRVV